MIHARTSWKVSPARSSGSLCNGSIGGATSPLERNASLAKSRRKESLSRRAATGPPPPICLAPPCTFHPGPRSSFDGRRVSCAGLVPREDMRMRLFWRKGPVAAGPGQSSGWVIATATVPSMSAAVGTWRRASRCCPKPGEVSCVADGCSDISPARASAMCSAESVAEQMPPPPSPPQASLSGLATSHPPPTPHRHKSLTDGAVCLFSFPRWSPFPVLPLF